MSEAFWSDPDAGSRDTAEDLDVGSRWRRFARRYGWRAYGLPVLAAVTVAALLQPAHPQPAHHSAAGAPTHGGAAAPNGSVAGGARRTPAATGRAAAMLAINLGDDGSACAGNGYAELVLVSVSRQRMWVCRGQRETLTTPVTTGRSIDHDQTPVGSWRVQNKERNQVLVGPGYRDHVRYWIPFNGDFGLHDAPWQTFPFGSPRYRTDGSHGCVHLPTPVMAWIYSWAVVGKTVVTVEA